jgi:hypothetical protein
LHHNMNPISVKDLIDAITLLPDLIKSGPQQYEEKWEKAARLRLEGKSYQEIQDELGCHRSYVAKLLAKAKKNGKETPLSDKIQSTQTSDHVEYWDLHQAVLNNESPEKTSWINTFKENLRLRFGYGRDHFTIPIVNYAWQMSEIVKYKKDDIHELELADDWWFRHYYVYKLAELLAWCDSAQQYDSVSAQLVRDFAEYWVEDKTNTQYVFDTDLGMREKFRNELEAPQLISIINLIRTQEAKITTQPELHELPSKFPELGPNEYRWWRLNNVTHRMAQFLLECYSHEDVYINDAAIDHRFHEIKKIVEQDLDRDFVFYKLLLYSIMDRRGEDADSLTAKTNLYENNGEKPFDKRAWNEIESFGPSFTISEAGSILSNSFGSIELLDLSLNFDNPQHGKFFNQRVGMLMNKVLVAKKQRDLGHYALRLLEAHLGWNSFKTEQDFENYVEEWEKANNSPPFGDLTKLSFSFKLVSDINTLKVRRPHGYSPIAFKN